MYIWYLRKSARGNKQSTTRATLARQQHAQQHTTYTKSTFCMVGLTASSRAGRPSSSAASRRLCNPSRSRVSWPLAFSMDALRRSSCRVHVHVHVHHQHERNRTDRFDLVDNTLLGTVSYGWTRPAPFQFGFSLSPPPSQNTHSSHESTLSLSLTLSLW